MATTELTPENVDTVDRSCPLCEADNQTAATLRYSHPDWRLKACRYCSFVYIENAPVYETLSSDMPWETTSQLEESRREATRGYEYKLSKTTRWRLHLLPRKQFAELLLRHAEPGNVIDLGCGDGSQLRNLHAGYIPHGVEVSESLCREANTRFQADGGYAVHAPSLEGLQKFNDQFFTAATLRSYLEHELQPAAILHELRRVLKPGGVVIIKVPNYGSLNRRLLGRDWCGFRFPEHLNYFTPATLRNMGEAAGFHVSFGLTYKLPTSDNMYAVMSRPA